jgi:MFS family permease
MSSDRAGSSKRAPEADSTLADYSIDATDAEPEIKSERQSPQVNTAQEESAADAEAALAYPLENISRGPFYALTFRNFRLFFVGQLISVAGTWMQTVAQNWLVWDVTHQGRWLGIVSGASAIPYVAFAMWGGQVADRYSRRVVLVWTQSLAMVLAFLLALLATNRPVNLQAWHIALFAGLLGIVNAFNMPAQQAFVTDMVDERGALSNAIALNSFRFNIARFAGPILAGIVLTRYGAPTCFFINGVSYIAVVISLMMMRLPRFMPTVQKMQIMEGVVYIWRTRAVFRVTALVGASSLFAWSVSTLFPMISAYFHRGESGYSAIMALQGIGAAVGSAALAITADRINRRALVYGGAFFFSIMLLAVAFSPTFYLSLLFLSLAGFAMIVFGMSAQIRIQEEVPDVLRGRVLAVYSLVFQGLMPVGGIEMGFLAEHLRNEPLAWLPNAGAQIAIALNAALCLTIAIGLYVWSVADRRKSPLR